jgi:hypothetical protein
MCDAALRLNTAVVGVAEGGRLYARSMRLAPSAEVLTSDGASATAAASEGSFVLRSSSGRSVSVDKIGEGALRVTASLASGDVAALRRGDASYVAVGVQESAEGVLVSNEGGVATLTNTSASEVRLESYGVYVL